MDNQNKTKQLGILLYPRVQPMDVLGPWEVFATWKNILGASLEMFLVAESMDLLACENNISLKPHCDVHTATQLDYLLIPGGPGRREQVHNALLIDFIRRQAQSCEYILSVCTGAFLLQAAGLLNGQRATTYWRAIEELKSIAELDLVEERLVQSGRIWTAGGVSSGIDLALAFIAEIAGVDNAGKVQLLFEYFPQQQLYCTEELTAELPPYSSQENPTKPQLPKYIKKIIQKNSDIK